MKTVLCFGDSNTWGAVPVPASGENRRFGPEERWPGVLRRELGAAWAVIEEGLPGRTTILEDPVEGARKSGLAYLVPCLESHRPIDLVVLMLGTNDLKSRFAMAPESIAAGIEVLLSLIPQHAVFEERSPQTLLICPPPVKTIGIFSPMFAGAAAKSARLAPLYRAVAARLGAAFLDAGEIIESSDVDGIHLDAGAHRRLGRAVAAAIGGLGDTEAA
jgi:lysophospholipase L1-like esterase